MYNKPITQRIAAARGKKPSALKQTRSGGPESKISVEKPGTPGETKDPTGGVKGRGTCSEIAASGNYDKAAYPTREAFMKACKGDVAAGKGAKEPTDCPEGFTYNATTKKCEKAGTPGSKEEKKIYTTDVGDALHTWQQRSVERGLAQSARKTGKFAGKLAKDQQRLANLEKRGKTDSPKYAKLKARVEARQKALDAQKNFAQTQRDMATQGVTPGTKQLGKISTYNPDDYGRVERASDLSRETQEKKIKDDFAKNQIAAADAAQNDVKRQAAENTANKTAAVTSDIITPDSGALFEDLQSPRTVAAMKKKSPLAMKSSFKMGGFGSKTYKK
jgi:hypothetical protein